MVVLFFHYASSILLLVIQHNLSPLLRSLHGRLVVVFAGSAEGLLGDLPLLHDGIALSLDFSFALAVGGLGLLEDVDNVLALGGSSVRVRGLSGG